jgi:hypothetical protein
MKKLLIAVVLLGAGFSAAAMNQEVTIKMETVDCEPISTEDYRKIMSGLVGETSAVTKLKVAKKSLKKGCVNLDQLAEIMDHLKSEEAKLEFAKLAYSSCTDQDNFLEIVQEKFSQAESLEELNGHITTLK